MILPILIAVQHLFLTDGHNRIVKPATNRYEFWKARFCHFFVKNISLKPPLSVDLHIEIAAARSNRTIVGKSLISSINLKAAFEEWAVLIGMYHPDSNDFRRQIAFIQRFGVCDKSKSDCERADDKP